MGDAENKFYGRTLPTYWLAAARVGDADALKNDLKLGTASLNVDENWIQIYESSPRRGPFFVTSHGLALQALSDDFVCDFWGETVVGGALPSSWEGARFSGL